MSAMETTRTTETRFTTYPAEPGQIHIGAGGANQPQVIAGPFPIDSSMFSSEAAFRERESRSGLLSQISSGAFSLLSDLGKNLSHISYEVTRGVNKMLHHEATSEHRFRTYFKLPAQEQLLAEFQCKFLHSNNLLLEGFCYISYNYFCFAPLITFSRPTSSQMLLVVIPLRDIENIQPAVSAASYIDVPTIQPITNPIARPDAMQIITRDRQVYNFFGFIDCLHGFNVLFHAWKSCDIFANLLQSSPVSGGVGVGVGVAGVGGASLGSGSLGGGLQPGFVSGTQLK